jgi:8-oxo-dGTP pyrophosphatase MutT (NUDIX family)
MTKPTKIRIVALCVFEVDNRILVFEGFDSVKGITFYRPLGGGVEPGETSKEAIIREMREETGQDIENARLLGVLEEIFTLEGKPDHQIFFVYDAEFIDKSLYQQTVIPVQEDNDEVINAIWKDLDSFDDSHLLVPIELHSLLESSNKQA